MLYPTKVALGVAVSALNLLWRGHGIFRSAPAAARFLILILVTWAITTVGEFLWFLLTGPRFTGFESPTADRNVVPVESADPLAVELSSLPPAALRDETLELAKEMKSFEAGTDREFVNTLAPAQSLTAVTESERDEALDKQSAELFQHSLRTWRTYRDRFYRPARMFRDELRKRLGIRNLNSEPRIPALEKAELTGAKPITQAADYLAGLARRLK